MRLLFLLLITLAVGAAEEECITLKDGRTFTGIYDDIAGTIEVTVGKSSAKIAIKPDQIAQRLATAAKPPERDFIAEASRFDEQQKEAEEQRKLLLGGDKTGVNQRRFYKTLIKESDAIFDRHLAKLKSKGPKS
jgi:hypothetical protein